MTGLSPDEARDLVLSVGTHHGKRRLSPLEVALLFNKMISAGATPMDCAEFVQLKGTTMISRFLNLLQLSPQIQHLIDWGQSGATISFSSASQLAALNHDEQEIAAGSIMANAMNKGEIQQVVQISKRALKNISSCIDEVLQMRPTVIRMHVLLGAIIDSDLREYLSNISQKKRDELLMKSTQYLYGELHDISGRMGQDKFTLVTDDNGARIIAESKHSQFEQEINNIIFTFME